MEQDTLYLTIFVAAYCAPQIAYCIRNRSMLGKYMSDKIFGGLENKIEGPLRKAADIIDS